MSGNDIEANHALRILQRAWSFAADEVIDLLRDRWLSIPTKDQFTWAALDACTTWTAAVEARHRVSRGERCEETISLHS